MYFRKYFEIHVRDGEENMSKYDSLNAMQQEAVFHTEGPVLILAGAGSGKTRVLTHRIAYLIEEKGINPWNIMAITFTNKAAQEMRERVDQIVGFGSESIWVSTFHSSCVRMLRRYIDRLGYDNNFTIYDTDDQKTVIKEICKRLNIDTKQFKERTLMAAISSAKDELVSPAEYKLQASTASGYGAQTIARVYEAYQKQLRQNNALDFDDLIVKTVELFQSCPDVLDYYQERFRYIMVDEYQDTNTAQFKFVSLLAEKYKNLCVVGDDDQSIYKFRGANIGNILGYEKVFPQAKVIKLEQNYRSTQNILNAANEVIKNNEGRKDKTLWTANEEGAPIHFRQFQNGYEEAEYIAGAISQKVREGIYDYKDCAILYRTNAQSRILEEALRKRGIPYKIYGGLSFYQRKEIKDVISYFRLIVNPHDEEALKRIINYPTRGIGDTTVGKLVGAATEYGVSLWTVLQAPLEYSLPINNGTAKKLSDFRSLIEVFIEENKKLSAEELATLVVKRSGIVSDLFQDRSVEGVSKQENLQELLKGIAEFCEIRREEGMEQVAMSDFLAEVSLLTDQDNDKEENSDKVTMMTVHAAKGLEFTNVFVVGLEEDLFPSSLSKDNPRAVEEERRLFYVAITRAEQNCVLSYAKSRYRNGKTDMCTPSRFLKDIDAKYLDMPSDAGASDAFASARERYGRPAFASPFRQPRAVEDDFVSPVKQAAQRQGHLTKLKNTMESSFSAAPATDASVLRVGQKVNHDRFGDGEIVSMEGEGGDAKVTVAFKNFGERRLLLKFAKLSVLG